MNSQNTPASWRCFENITPGQEAASVAASCAFSLATLEVASSPDSAGFALTERKQPEVWRWALIGPAGFLLEEGFEPSQDRAKKAAEEALELSRAVTSAA